MTVYTVHAYVNVGEDNYRGYTPRAPISPVSLPGSADPITFMVVADDVLMAAEILFSIGNRYSTDIHDQAWPSDIRSLSVGDLVDITDVSGEGQWFYSVDSCGWTEIVEPTNPRVPIEGTMATSRVAA